MNYDKILKEVREYYDKKYQSMVILLGVLIGTAKKGSL